MNLPRFLRFTLSSALAIMGTACDPCENHILQEEPAPNQTRKAVVFQRQCGALGGMSTQVSILPTSARPFAGGNVFGADANADPSLETPSGGPPVAVKWVGEQELRIAHDARIRVFQSEKAMGNVTITYETQAPEQPEPALESKPSSPKRRR